MMRYWVLIFIFGMFLSGFSKAQEVKPSSRQPPDTAGGVHRLKPSGFRTVVDSIEQGIVSGNVQVFSGHLARQIYITLRGKEGGYFSANQAFYILQEYFSSRHAVNFRFTTVNADIANPYATGGGTFFVKGNPEILQLYVALARADGRWVIAQFNVY